MRFLALSTLALVAVATPAMAQDEATLSGPYVGVFGGVDSAGDSTDTPTGGLIGVNAGYDIRFGSGLAGIEGSAAYSTAKTCLSNAVVPGDRACVKGDRDFFIGARLGVALDEKTVAYVKGGYANGNVKFSYTLGGTTTSTSDAQNGIRGGVGVEHKFASKLSIRGEVTYTDYENSFTRLQGTLGVAYRF